MVLVETGLMICRDGVDTRDNRERNTGIGMFIAVVIMGVIFGFVGGAIIAFIYNFALGWMGGIEVDLEVKQ